MLAEAPDPLNVAATSTSEDFDHLVYIRTIEACNLHCRHCFIPNNPARMSQEQKVALPDQVRRFARAGQTVIVQWHGGEPTLVGLEWLRDAIETLERGAPEIRFVHGIQTNAMNYTSEWANLYHTYFGGEVGVSWDPEIRQLRAGRPDTNAEYERRFWPRVEQMLADGLRPYLVVTGTRHLFERFRRPQRFFEFLIERGIHDAHIERLTKTGYAVEHWQELGVDNGEFSDWMARWARAYRVWDLARSANGEPRLNLSPFDGLFRSVSDLQAGRASGGYGCWSGGCDTRFHTIDAREGYQTGCTAVTARSPGTTEGGRGSSGTEKPVMFFRNMRQHRQADCANCRYRPICSTGCLNVEYLDSTGECSGGYRLFEAIDRIVSP